MSKRELGLYGVEDGEEERKYGRAGERSLWRDVERGLGVERDRKQKEM